MKGDIAGESWDILMVEVQPMKFSKNYRIGKILNKTHTHTHTYLLSHHSLKNSKPIIYDHVFLKQDLLMYLILTSCCSTVPSLDSFL